MVLEKEKWFDTATIKNSSKTNKHRVTSNVVTTSGVAIHQSLMAHHSHSNKYEPLQFAKL